MESELTNLLQKLKVEDNELSSNDLSELVKHLNTAFENKQETEVNNLLQTVGDLARDSDNRAILITEESLFDSLSTIINSQSSNDTLKLAARAIGNLCFENVVSRKLFRKRDGIIQSIINLLKSANGDEVTLRNCAGSLANLASDNEENQKEIGSLGGIPLLLPLLKSSSEVVQHMASKAIHNTIDTEENQPIFVKESGIQAYMLFLDQDEEQLQCDFMSILLSLAYNDALRSEVVKLLPLLVSIVKGKIGVQDSDELVENAFDVLVILSDKEDSKQEFVKNNLVHSIFQLEKKGGNVKKAVLKIMAGLSTIESAMKDFFQYFEPILQALTETEEVERVLSCLLIIGNLLRSNEHCKKAGEYKGFIELMMKYSDHKDLRIQHLALGVLRNLCVLVENKGKVVDAGLLDLVVKHLTQAEQPNAHIQYGITQILRSLIASGGDSFIPIIVKHNNVLEALVRLAKGELTPETKQEEEETEEAPKEKDRRVEYEATRIIVRITDKAENCEEIVKLGGAGPLVELVKSQYEILQAEGVKGIHNIVKAGIKVEEAKEAVKNVKTTNEELAKLVNEILSQ